MIKVKHKYHFMQSGYAWEAEMYSSIKISFDTLNIAENLRVVLQILHYEN